MSVRGWVNLVARQACVCAGEPLVHIHHVLGRSARFQKMPIGQWVVLPLWIPLHDINSDHEFHVQKHPKEFIREYGEQMQLFLDMAHGLISDVYSSHIKTPKSNLPSFEIMEAIRVY